MTILATVGTQCVTVEDFREAWSRQRDKPDTVENRVAVLDDLVARKAQVAEALRLGVEKSVEFRRQYESLLISHLRATELEPQLQSAEVQPEAVWKHYQENEAAYSRQGSLHVAALFCPAETNDQPRRAAYRHSLAVAREQALSLTPETRGFGALAVLHTHHQPSRFTGGDLGWLSVEARYSDFRKTVLRIAKELQEKGALSQVEEDDLGLYLVRLIDRREATKDDFSMLQESIRRKLLREQREALEEAFPRSALNRFRVQVWKSHLAAMPLPHGREVTQKQMDVP